jgi:hypothetical protein
MKDLITYTKDVKLLVSEGRLIASDPYHVAHGLFIVDDGGQSLTFNITKTPVIYSKNGASLALVRGVDELVFENVSSIEVIGWFDPIESCYVFYDGGQQKYESVYSVKPIDVDGVLVPPPYMFGVFS